MFRVKKAAKAVVPLLVGVLFAFGQPPFKLYEFVILGLGIFAMATYNSTPRKRFLFGFLCGISQYLISLIWVTGFSVPGYLVIVVYDSILFGLAALIFPSRQISKHSTLITAITFGLCFSLIDAFRSRFPFGGLPIDGLAISQSDSFLKYFAIIGGEPAIVFFTATFSALMGLALLKLHKSNPYNQLKSPEFFVSLIAILLIITFSEVLSYANQITSQSYLSAVAVQGGGKTGLRAVVNGNQQRVFDNQVNESYKINKKIDLILWPEDTVALSQPLTESYDYSVLKTLAKRFNAYMLVGVTQPVGNSKFLNLAVLLSPTGRILGSYLKVHRVPFGEYVPYRSFFEHFGNVNLVPRNAIAGTKPGELTYPVGKIGIMISYEVFFDNRAYVDVKNGAQVILVPTNTASYKGSQMPQEELGALKIRAIETDRYVLMTSPTGYSVEVNPKGKIIQISKLGVPALTYANLGLINHLTPFDIYGDLPPIVLEMFSLFLIYVVLVVNRKGHKNNR